MSRYWMGLAAIAALTWACSGGGGETADSEEAAASTSAEPAAGSGLNPCELLTSDEVDSALPGHDEGLVARSGGSLIEGVDSYQCSYSTEAGDVLTVIVHRASNDAAFEEIEPDPSTARMTHPNTFREVSVGDRGWLSGESDDLKLTAVQGHDVVEIELMAEAAAGRGDALASLGAAVAKRIG